MNKSTVDNRIDDLLDELNNIAQDYDCEYGLPKYNKEVRGQLQEAVRQFLIEIEDKQ